MLQLACAVLAACSFVVGATSPVPTTKPKKPAELLIGEWKLTEASDTPCTPDGVFVTFTQGGEMTLRKEYKGKDAEKITLKGKYTLKGDDKIDCEIEDDTGRKDRQVLTIKKLTDDDLVTLDELGIKTTFKRIKPAKK